MPRYFLSKKDGCYYVEDTVSQVTVILGVSEMANDYLAGIIKQNKAEEEAYGTRQAA